MGRLYWSEINRLLYRNAHMIYMCNFNIIIYIYINESTIQFHRAINCWHHVYIVHIKMKHTFHGIQFVLLPHTTYALLSFVSFNTLSGLLYYPEKTGKKPHTLSMAILSYYVNLWSSLHPIWFSMNSTLPSFVWPLDGWEEGGGWEHSGRA